MAGALRRVPIRVRLALAFALVTTAALTGIGFLVYERTSDALSDRIDRELTQSAGAAFRGPDRDRHDRSPGGAVTQVIAADGSVVGGGYGLTALLTQGQVARVIRSGRATTLEKDIDGEPVRILALPVSGGQGVVVAAQSVADRDAALGRLRSELLIGGAIALLLAAAGGYGLAALALRPVEAMRRRAAAIGPDSADGRLPVPPARDEIRRLGDTLNGMLARLEDGVARERAFVADAAHELRTPLAVMQGEVELATARPRTARELRTALDSVGEEAARLSQLAEDLLVIARSDQGRLPIRPEPIDVAALLDRVARRYAVRAMRAGWSVSAEAAPGLCLRADPMRLEQALGNLVENALRHGRGPVTLAARADRDRVVLAVRDRGDGFALDFIPRAFERFSRAESGRTGAGAGLGLAIVAAIAAAHGGEAGVRNRPDGGAEAWLAIPDGAPERAVSPGPAAP